MVYQIDSYRYWEAHLQRNDFEYGQFGENLTVDGLADNEVCIGDRYRIGNAVFEVTQPRVTCYRVGIRMDNPDMPSLLVSHHRPGFYCRVVEEGDVGAGDEIIKIADGPERVTVAEMDGLLYLPGHSRDQLERALRVPALSEGWKGSLNALLSSTEQGGNAGLAPTSPRPAWSGFQPLRVAEVRRECDGVLSFVFEAVDRTSLPVPSAGQFLVFKIEAEGLASPVLRSYSISGPPDAGRYRISVKREGGPGSQYFHDHLQASDSLQVSAPRGAFTLTASRGPVVFLSAGIGATPVLSMLHELARTSATSAQEIWWCYGARNGREHPFAAEVRDLLSNFQHGHSIVLYSKPDDQDRLGHDYDAPGRLSLSYLKARDVPQTADFYLCGPPAFLADLSEELKGWNVPVSRIHSETFGAGTSLTPGIAGTPATLPHPPSGEPGPGPNISFTRTGLTVPWDSRFGSLLEFAEACDVPVRWSCRVGVCHTCQTGKISGSVKYKPTPLDQPEESDVLLCCATPLSEIELDL
jgi:ferredoxin-NADP reductase/MOSC domain-containing protein YiiM/ferredoxin